METSPLVGAWRLISFEEHDPHGNVTYPRGREVQGILTYTADGYMCLAIMNPARPSIASKNHFEATDQELVAAARDYGSYAGRYQVAGDRILHHVEISLIPNWVGATQERTYTFDGNRLTLSAAFMRSGMRAQAMLVWERAAQAE